MLLSESELIEIDHIRNLVNCNPYKPERHTIEAALLEHETVTESFGPHSGFVDDLIQKVERFIGRLSMRLAAADAVPQDVLLNYEHLVFYLLFQRYYDAFEEQAQAPRQNARFTFFESYKNDLQRLLLHRDSQLKTENEPSHLFAVHFQMVRTHLALKKLLPISQTLNNLCANLWDVLFSNNLLRYRRVLYRRLSQLPIALVGPNGSDWETLTQVVADSRYLEFDAVLARFPDWVETGFETLYMDGCDTQTLRTQLFGDPGKSLGLLRECPAFAMVHLAGLDTCDPGLQRQLWAASAGASDAAMGRNGLRFKGRLLISSETDPLSLAANGQILPELAQSLSSCLVRVPGLWQIQSESADVVLRLARQICANLVGRAESEQLLTELAQSLETFGPQYLWPGNMAELERCVRQVAMTGECHPSHLNSADPRLPMGDDYLAVETPLNTIVNRYCTLAYARYGSYLETARQLDMDRRTVKARIDHDLLDKLDRLGLVRQRQEEG